MDSCHSSTVENNIDLSLMNKQKNHECSSSMLNWNNWAMIYWNSSSNVFTSQRSWTTSKTVRVVVTSFQRACGISLGSSPRLVRCSGKPLQTKWGAIWTGKLLVACCVVLGNFSSEGLAFGKIDARVIRGEWPQGRTWWTQRITTESRRSLARSGPSSIQGLMWLELLLHLLKSPRPSEVSLRA